MKLGIDFGTTRIVVAAADMSEEMQRARTRAEHLKAILTNPRKV